MASRVQLCQMQTATTDPLQSVNSTLDSAKSERCQMVTRRAIKCCGPSAEPTRSEELYPTCAGSWSVFGAWVWHSAEVEEGDGLWVGASVKHWKTPFLAQELFICPPKIPPSALQMNELSFQSKRPKVSHSWFHRWNLKARGQAEQPRPHLKRQRAEWRKMCPNIKHLHGA